MASESPISQRLSWLGPRLGRRSYLLIGLAAAAVAIDLTTIILRRQHHGGDFDISMEFGRRFLNGEFLYRGGLHFPYMPAAAMWFGLFALLPVPVAFALSYWLAIGSIVLVVWILRRSVFGVARTALSDSYYVEITTLLLASHYIVRDLDDAGLNSILLGFVMLGVYLVGRKYYAVGSLSIGLAIALKATCGIFVPFLIWKRQWSLALLTAASAALWIMLPAVWMGPANWWAAERDWIDSAVGFALGRYPAAELYYGYLNVGNQALRPALQYLLTACGGYLYYTARIISALGALLLIGAFCWAIRRPYTREMGIQWLSESSALLIVALMLAPVAWVQHMVFALPAIYMVAASWFLSERAPTVVSCALVAYLILVFGLSRTILGKAGYQVALACHMHTAALLIILVLVLNAKVSDRPRIATAQTE
jgi:Glycosyltransferase family 87